MNSILESPLNGSNGLSPVSTGGGLGPVLLRSVVSKVALGEIFL
jgi:hypothetical protein